MFETTLVVQPNATQGTEPSPSRVAEPHILVSARIVVRSLMCSQLQLDTNRRSVVVNDATEYFVTLLDSVVTNCCGRLRDYNRAMVVSCV
jgi:hypothetical protein